MHGTFDPSEQREVACRMGLEGKDRIGCELRQLVRIRSRNWNCPAVTHSGKIEYPRRTMADDDAQYTSGEGDRTHEDAQEEQVRVEQVNARPDPLAAA